MDQITRDSGPRDLDQLCLQEKNRKSLKGRGFVGTWQQTQMGEL